MVKKKSTKDSSKKQDKEHHKTLKLKTSRDIAMDFAEKVYEKYSNLIKSVILFGSTAKNKRVVGSDIDLIILVDDASVRFDEKFIQWYREELGKLIESNPYKKDLHINTVKLTTWWEDLQKGDPTIINIIRYGEALIDIGGFFMPLKMLLQDGKIKPTPESIHAILNRVPNHILRSKVSKLSSIEGCYWSFVESSQALLMAIKILPPSPEKIPELLREHLVSKGLLNKKFISYFQEITQVHKQIVHGAIKDINGKIIDDFQSKSEEFFKTTVKILDDILE
ncbi:hypothetical protein CMI42_01445 [Candidatus Pacearchaeota archaeon]|nr:hypothetical protein [Candidatus Pacearchaeota archaeon]